MSDALDVTKEPCAPEDVMPDAIQKASLALQETAAEAGWAVMTIAAPMTKVQEWLADPPGTKLHPLYIASNVSDWPKWALLWAAGEIAQIEGPKVMEQLKVEGSA